MAKTKKSENVPSAMREKFTSIVKITDEFSKALLNDEYAQLIRFATAALCRKRPSPIASGKDRSWACGITHAIGMVNFLFDPSQDPHVGAKELYKWFRVSASTGQSKSKRVRDILGMHQLDPNWCLPGKLNDNPMAWTISVSGLVIDARYAPLEVQEIAYAKGLIPYIPGSDNDDYDITIKTVDNPKNGLYTLEVFMVGGPVTEQFIERNPEVSRTIEIRGGQTLEDLHNIIFGAFDREDSHMYEFQVGGQGPHDPKARRYVLVEEINDPVGSSDPAGEVSSTMIDSLNLSVDDAFGYWFDFGDDWWHQINVTSIKTETSKGKYPRITARVGESPPQYPDSEHEY